MAAATGANSMPSALMEYINDEYLGNYKVACQELSDAFSKRNPSLVPGSTTEEADRRSYVLAGVYPVVILPSFLTPEAYVRVYSALETEVRYEEKRADLYRFYQTADLKDGGLLGSQAIKELHKSLLSWVPFVEKVIGRPLSRRLLDLSSQRYCKNEYLLGHDDRLDSRRVAFVLYFLPEALEGGSLEFYPTDWKQRPLHCGRAQAWHPKDNHIAFFEVGKDSHHQVAEVFSGKRISVAGWLHDPLPEESVNFPIGISDTRHSIFSNYSPGKDIINFVFTPEFHMKITMAINYRWNDMIRVQAKDCAFHFYQEVEEAEWMRELQAALFRDFNYLSRPTLKVFRRGDYRLSSPQNPPANLLQFVHCPPGLSPSKEEDSVSLPTGTKLKDNCLHHGANPLPICRRELLNLPSEDDYIAIIEMSFES